MNKDDFNAKIQDLGNKLGIFAKAATEKTTEIAQATVKASKETITIGKLNLKITEEKGYIRQKYEKLGKMIYDKYSDDMESLPEEFKDLVSEIKVGFETISLFENKIQDVKNNGCCDECDCDEDSDDKDVEYENSDITTDDIDEEVSNIIPINQITIEENKNETVEEVKEEISEVINKETVGQTEEISEEKKIEE